MSLSARRLQRTARDTARGLDNVTNGRPFTEHLDVFKVGAKVFLIVTDDPAEPIITVKADPDRGDDLRCRHPTIVPGRYLDKTLDQHRPRTRHHGTPRPRARAGFLRPRALSAARTPDP
ncbi:MmcQ/YjbR family DNA-binding protein [Agilicoccus flavus]|uniref:MmcQ/YjbR family DNA-binding protein n=1 Tax=Agilicoccus flavus TaxID=2775968 RepID=UPI001CF63A9F|nr:MmcQ/YjbR family DNA-binding protein [Agilicoccus flavus]